MVIIRTAAVQTARIRLVGAGRSGRVRRQQQLLAEDVSSTSFQLDIRQPGAGRAFAVVHFPQHQERLVRLVAVVSGAAEEYNDEQALEDLHPGVAVVHLAAVVWRAAEQLVRANHGAVLTVDAAVAAAAVPAAAELVDAAEIGRRRLPAVQRRHAGLLHGGFKGGLAARKPEETAVEEEDNDHSDVHAVGV